MTKAGQQTFKLVSLVVKERHSYSDFFFLAAKNPFFIFKNKSKPIMEGTGCKVSKIFYNLFTYNFSMLSAVIFNNLMLYTRVDRFSFFYEF